jgi:hypothetical protein
LTHRDRIVDMGGGAARHRPRLQADPRKDEPAAG